MQTSLAFATQDATIVGYPKADRKFSPGFGPIARMILAWFEPINTHVNSHHDSTWHKATQSEVKQCVGGLVNPSWQLTEMLIQLSSWPSVQRSFRDGFGAAKTLNSFAGGATRSFPLFADRF